MAKHPTHNSPLPQFTPARNSMCLCGSGLKFKRCCADRLLGSNLGNDTRKFLAQQKYKDALNACRADITQYTIWYKSHTEPAMQRGMPKTGSFYEIDLRAMAELVDTLLTCYLKAGMNDEFPAALERLRRNINEDEWQRKIVYFHALHALGPDWNKSAGKRELKKLGPVTDDDDVETTQLYLDLFWQDLSFSEKQDLIDKILSQSTELSDRLQYKGTKAYLYITIGDFKKSEAELSEIIAEVTAVQESDGEALSDYEKYRLAMAYDLLGSLRKDDLLLNDALNLFQQILKDVAWTADGHANILRQMGEIYHRKNDWEQACKYYSDAFSYEPADIFKVLMSESLIQMDKLEDAAKTLSEVNFESLTDDEQLDYTFAAAALAIELEDHKQLENAKRLLNATNVCTPYFREHRDSFLLNVQEALNSGTSRPLLERTRKLLSTLGRSAASYVILQPNFMGLGVDIGKIVDDLAKGQDTHTR